MREAGLWVRLWALALACAPLAACAPAAHAQQIYSCPQPGSPPRYQDRPCAATPPAESQPRPADAAALPLTAVPAPAEPRGKRTAVVRASAPESATAAMPPIVSPSLDPALPPDRPETRAEYVSRNERRCTAGDRRACVAVTCERSGGLGTKDCQAALGYRRGNGWDLRPAADVFDPARSDDEYALRCTQRSQRARVTVPRAGGDAHVHAGAEPPITLPLAGLADFATRYCAAR